MRCWLLTKPAACTGSCQGPQHYDTPSVVVAVETVVPGDQQGHTVGVSAGVSTAVGVRAGGCLCEGGVIFIYFRKAHIKIDINYNFKTVLTITN